MPIYCECRDFYIQVARSLFPRFVKTNDRGENDLASYCVREGIKHVVFTAFADVLPVLQAIANGQTTVENVLEKGITP